MNTGEKEMMQEMEKNVGRKCRFTSDDGVLTGLITGVSNTEHYCVKVNHPSIWEWYVRAEAVTLL